jgi:hypothetical protein
MAPDFEKTLVGFDVGELDRHRGAVFGLWPDLTLAYLNPAWFAFAAANDGDEIPARWGLGRYVLEAVPDVLDRFYRRLYMERLEKAWIRTPYPLAHSYECSSATVYRRFAMHVYALRRGKGLLVVNSPFVESPHGADRPAANGTDAAYRNAEGLVLQCAHCRRVESQRLAGSWDWVPRWVDEPPKGVVAALCEVCRDYYYPDERTTR